jgi:hypothetical protein
MGFEGPNMSSPPDSSSKEDLLKKQLAAMNPDMENVMDISKDDVSIEAPSKNMYEVKMAEKKNSVEGKQEQIQLVLDNAKAIMRTKAQIEGWDDEVVTQAMKFVEINDQELINSNSASVDKTDELVSKMSAKADELTMSNS